LPVCQQQQQQQEVVAIDPLSQKIDLSFIEKEMEAVASATEIGNTFNVHGAVGREGGREGGMEAWITALSLLMIVGCHDAIMFSLSFSLIPSTFPPSLAG